VQWETADGLAQDHDIHKQRLAEDGSQLDTGKKHNVSAFAVNRPCGANGRHADPQHMLFTEQRSEPMPCVDARS